MAEIQEALAALDVEDYMLRGIPTNESEFNSMFTKITGEDSDGTAIEDSTPANFGVTWTQVSAKLTELENAEPMKLLREERNSKLAETDWWASSDLTMTAAQTTYRQALRDIPDNYSSLETVVWPTKP